jgi:drug/metabolite transporter (DMT)-like permease
MQLWLLIVIIAQVIYSFVALMDKYIITSKKIQKPFFYGFFVSSLSVIPIFLYALSTFEIKIGAFAMPLMKNVGSPDVPILAMAFVAAFAGFNGLVSLYRALRLADASDVIPVVGSLSAVGTFILSFVVFAEQLSSNFLFGFVLLVLGTLLVSHFRFVGKKDVLLSTIHAGVLFALKAVMIKGMFDYTSFDDAFFWSRIGLALYLVSIVLIPRFRRKIIANTKRTKTSGGLLVVANSILGGVAAFLTLKAIELGDVTLVQALGGLQFLFLTVISFLVGWVIPKHFGENNTLEDILQKGIAVILIMFGFFLLFL